MEEMKKKIFRKIVELAELEGTEEIENFPYDAPLFAVHREEGKPCLGLDSLTSLELAVAIMDEFGVHVADEDIDRLSTVDSIAAYITNKCGE